MERIQKILAARGVASRRNAEKLILDGRVTCNGNICTLGESANEDDVICLDGIPILANDKKVYLMLNKPRGYVTTLRDEKGRKNVAQLVSACGIRVYPVGRLDMDSEGLLLFTNDGDFANRLMHPSHEVDKTYRVLVDGVSQEQLLLLKRPIKLDGYQIKAPSVTALNEKNVLLITIHEGRNRQVRRMCAAAGMRVKRLIRISEGNLLLGDLKPGQWRYLTDQEVTELLR